MSFPFGKAFFGRCYVSFWGSAGIGSLVHVDCWALGISWIPSPLGQVYRGLFLADGFLVLIRWILHGLSSIPSMLRMTFDVPTWGFQRFHHLFENTWNPEVSPPSSIENHAKPVPCQPSSWDLVNRIAVNDLPVKMSLLANNLKKDSGLARENPSQ